MLFRSMSVGGPPHVILGQEMLKPRDGNEKDEGELTGGKRLIQRLRKRHGHFADLIVADALYLNAPFINTVLSCGMETVIRLKDEKRLIFKDAQGLFEKGAVNGLRKKLRNVTLHNSHKQYKISFVTLTKQMKDLYDKNFRKKKQNGHFKNN